jgi:hypothetical protein
LGIVRISEQLASSLRGLDLPTILFGIAVVKSIATPVRHAGKGRTNEKGWENQYPYAFAKSCDEARGLGSSLGVTESAGLGGGWGSHSKAKHHQNSRLANQLGCVCPHLTT